MAHTPTTPLSPEQEAEVQRLAALMHAASQDDFLQLARLLVGKPANQLFGATEFDVRDHALQLAAETFQVALNDADRGVFR
jgi:hypothetical protein